MVAPLVGAGLRTLLSGGSRLLGSAARSTAGVARQIPEQARRFGADALKYAKDHPGRLALDVGLTGAAAFGGDAAARVVMGRQPDDPEDTFALSAQSRHPDDPGLAASEESFTRELARRSPDYASFATTLQGLGIDASQVFPEEMFARLNEPGVQALLQPRAAPVQTPEQQSAYRVDPVRARREAEMNMTLLGL